RGEVPAAGGRRLRFARGPGPGLGPDSDARLRRAAGVPAVAARSGDRDGPFLAALRAGAEVPADARDTAGRTARRTGPTRQARAPRRPPARLTSEQARRRLQSAG